MSAKRPKGRRKEDTTSENAFAGHVVDDFGILRSVTTVGRTMVKPDEKYSCIALVNLDEFSEAYYCDHR